MPRFSDNKRTRTAEDQFLTLMVVARENKGIADTLLAILRQDDFNRKSVLNSWINDLRLQSAPHPFVSALSILLDSDIAARAKDLLEEP